MRHLRTVKKLKRTSEHRKATLSALSKALIEHKKITTTLTKAKVARTVVERLITRAKNAVKAEGEAKNVHARRIAYAFLRSRTAVKILFDDVAAKVAERPGGYTRIVRVGRRHGDAAETAILELVDYAGETGKKQAKGPRKPIRAKKASGSAPSLPAATTQKEEPGTAQLAAGTAPETTTPATQPTESEQKSQGGA